MSATLEQGLTRNARAAIYNVPLDAMSEFCGDVSA
jgi:hypothetical protein